MTVAGDKLFTFILLATAGAACGQPADMTPKAPIVIEGEIHFVDVTSSVPHATVYVRLEDVSLADAPSKVIAEELIPNISIEAEGQPSVPFSIRTPGLDERAVYTLTVHVDVGGSGEITLGDYITMESYPVSPTVSPTYINVRVRPVK